MVKLPKLGVGITFFSGFESVLRDNVDLIDVIEIEPQTIWKQESLESNKYLINYDILKSIKSFEIPKLVHSVGLPVGGTHLPDSNQISLLKKMISELDAPWMSEHLSFNQAKNDNGNFFTGFFLPPSQTFESVKSCIKSINHLKKKVSIPLAIEVGVNYLKPRKDELSDGQFISAVTNGANCGILLDLHNIWTNSINGHQNVSDFLKEIPLERVWEIHVAGGFEEDGYWLDAHSGEIPKPLFNLAKKLIPKLTNLSAIIFELFPSYYPQFGSSDIRSQLKLIHKLWNNRPTQSPKVESLSIQFPKKKLFIYTPIEWEKTLGSLVTHQQIDNQLSRELYDDPAIKLYKKLIHSFRASMIIQTLKITTRLLSLTLGKVHFNELLEKYFKELTPNQFASSEAKQFTHYLLNKKLKVQYLDEVIAFELAVISTLLDNKNRIVRFDHEPLPVLMSILKNVLPSKPKKGNFEIEITSDSIKNLNKKQKLEQQFEWQSMRWHH